MDWAGDEEEEVQETAPVLCPYCKEDLKSEGLTNCPFCHEVLIKTEAGETLFGETEAERERRCRGGASARLRRAGSGEAETAERPV